MTVATADAGYVSQPEEALDRIFAQPAFGAEPVDVRFEPARTLYSTWWSSVDTSGDLGALFSLATSPATIYAFFVDAVNWCGGSGAGIVGCGAMPGNAVVVASDWAASAYGAALIAHEAGHNLGLDHWSEPGNLMYGALTGSTVLAASQAATVLASSLVQRRDGVRALSITPIAVVAGDAAYAAGTVGAAGAEVAAVPEPGSAALAALGLALAACAAGRRRMSSNTDDRSVRIS